MRPQVYQISGKNWETNRNLIIRFRQGILCNKKKDIHEKTDTCNRFNCHKCVLTDLLMCIK